MILVCFLKNTPTMDFPINKVTIKFNIQMGRLLRMKQDASDNYAWTKPGLSQVYWDLSSPYFKYTGGKYQSHGVLVKE